MKTKLSRQEANRKILEKIAKAIESNPNWRFHQILQNMCIEIQGEDQFFEESRETLENCIDV